METFTTVVYGCETKDGKSGFGEGKIRCTDPVDAELIFQLIQEMPDRFGFAPIEKGQKRLVNYQGKIIYLD